MTIRKFRSLLFVALALLVAALAVPAFASASAPDREAVTAGDKPAEKKVDKKIELNSATAKELQSLPGIGPAIAKRIVAYAKSTGFSSVDDLKKVKGIGDKKFAKIKDLVTVTPKKKADK